MGRAVQSRVKGYRLLPETQDFEVTSDDGGRVRGERSERRITAQASHSPETAVMSLEGFKDGVKTPQIPQHQPPAPLYSVTIK